MSDDVIRPLGLGAPVWESAAITILRNDIGYTLVPGEVTPSIPGLAVTPGQSDAPGAWVITHRPSGWRVRVKDDNAAGLFATPDEAKAVLVMLGALGDWLRPARAILEDASFRAEARKIVDAHRMPEQPGRGTETGLRRHTDDETLTVQGSRPA